MYIYINIYILFLYLDLINYQIKELYKLPGNSVVNSMRFYAEKNLLVIAETNNKVFTLLNIG